MTGQSESFWKNKITELEMRVEQLEEELFSAQISSNKDDYYTIAEYAAVMKVCPATVYHHIKNGNIPAYKLGKNYRIPKNKVKSNVI